MTFNNTKKNNNLNKNNNKLIVYFDGIDSIFENYLKNFDLFTCKKLLDEYSDRVKKQLI